MSDEVEHGLDGAYSLEKPEDSVAYYKDWATSYDTEFAVTHGYVVPRHVGQAFRELGGEGPVLDIGAGTGLVAEHMPDVVIDGIDISQEMLDVAGGKGIYRNLICADLTRALDITDGTYQGFVSAGTFTHGHVGPVCLPELMRIARPGALFVATINAQVFDAAGFGSAFAGLVANGSIEPVGFREVNYYDSADHEHANDKGLLASFRRL